MYNYKYITYKIVESSKQQFKNKYTIIHSIFNLTQKKSYEKNKISKKKITRKKLEAIRTHHVLTLNPYSFMKIGKKTISSKNNLFQTVSLTKLHCSTRCLKIFFCHHCNFCTQQYSSCLKEKISRSECHGLIFMFYYLYFHCIYFYIT